MAITSRIQGVTAALAIKVPVLVASTANITTSSTQVIDGIAVSSSDRVLLKDQTDASENGIYVVDSGTWSRAKDFDGSLDVVRGTLVYTSTGTANGGRFFNVTSTGNNVPGTNSITFAEAPFSSQLIGALDTNSFAINESEGSAVTGSSETEIWQSDGNTVHVTGSTIETMSTAPRIGAMRRVVFSSSGFLVHSTTSLILPSSANIRTLDGDVAFIYADSTVLSRVMSYLPRDSGREFSVLESITASDAILRNSGISVIASASATARNVSLAFPQIGSRKEILIDCTSSHITISSTLTTILFRSSAGSCSTAFKVEGIEPMRGESMLLRGLSTVSWLVTSKSAAVSS